MKNFWGSRMLNKKWQFPHDSAPTSREEFGTISAGGPTQNPVAVQDLGLLAFALPLTLLEITKVAS